MCVIVHVGAKKTLPEQLLENCYDRNPDGWGILWAKHGKLHSVKETSNFKDFWKIWHDVPRDAERAVHFRIKTHGLINKDNCHPFFPSANVGLMHNGIIDTNLVNKDWSDTYNFCEYELKPFIKAYEEANENCLSDKPFANLLTELAAHSRLLLMNKEGQILKINPESWVSRYGCDFSNGGNFEPRYKSNTGYSRSTDNQYGFWENGRWVERRGETTNSIYDGVTGMTDEEIRDTFGGEDYPMECDVSQASGGINRTHNNPLDWRTTQRKNQVAGKYTTLQVTDLSSGNKTEEETAKYIEEIESQRQEALDDAKGATPVREEEMLEHIKNAVLSGDTGGVDEKITSEACGPSPEVTVEEVTDDLPEDDLAEESDDPEMFLEIDQILMLSPQDLQDFVVDFPRSAVCTIEALANACARHSILEVEYRSISTSKKSVVSG